MEKDCIIAYVALYPPYLKSKDLKSLFMFYRTHYVDFSVIIADIAIYPSATEETRLSNVRQWYMFNGYALVTEWLD